MGWSQDLLVLGLNTSICCRCTEVCDRYGWHDVWWIERHLILSPNPSRLLRSSGWWCCACGGAVSVASTFLGPPTSPFSGAASHFVTIFIIRAIITVSLGSRHFHGQRKAGRLQSVCQLGYRRRKKRAPYCLSCLSLWFVAFRALPVRCSQREWNLTASALFSLQIKAPACLLRNGSMITVHYVSALGIQIIVCFMLFVTSSWFDIKGRNDSYTLRKKVFPSTCFGASACHK